MRILRTFMDYVTWFIIFRTVVVVALDQKYAYQTILAADIGGTFTRLSLIEMGKPWRNLSVMRTSERYINSQFSSFEDIMTAFLSKAGWFDLPTLLLPLTLYSGNVPKKECTAMSRPPTHFPSRSLTTLLLAFSL